MLSVIPNSPPAEPKTNTLLNGPNAPTQEKLQVRNSFLFLSVIRCRGFGSASFCQIYPT